MPILLNGVQGKAFEGKYHPVIIGTGANKGSAFGWIDTDLLSGEALSQSDTYDCNMPLLNIGGKSTQTVSVQSRNSFDKNKRLLSKVLTEIGTLVDSSLSDTSDFINVNPNTSYRISGHSSGAVRAVAAYDINKTLINVISNTIGDVTITTQSNVYFIRFSLAKTQVDTAQFELGTVSTPYTPFVPNSPSPDYKSPINSVSNFNLLSKSNANMIPYDPLTWGEWTLINSQNITKDISGITITEDGSKWMEIRRYNVGKPSTKYGLLYNVVSCTLTHNAMFNVLFNGAIDKTMGIHKFIATSSASLPYNYFNLYTEPSVAGEHIKLKDFRLYELPVGSRIEYDFTNLTADELNSKYPFVAKANIITSTINYPYMLRSLPDGTKDYIVVDNIAKTAKLVRNVEEVVLNGTESWVYYSNNIKEGYSTFIVTTLPSAVGLQKSICTHFSNINTIWDLYKDGFSDHSTLSYKYFTITNTHLGIISSDTGVQRVNKYKAWLTLNNATLQYQLAIPIITDLPYTVVKEYYPQTNVYTNATVQPTLQGKFRVIGNYGY